MIHQRAAQLNVDPLSVAVQWAEVGYTPGLTELLTWNPQDLAILAEAKVLLRKELAHDIVEGLQSESKRFELWEDVDPEGAGEIAEAGLLEAAVDDVVESICP